MILLYKYLKQGSIKARFYRSLLKSPKKGQRHRDRKIWYIIIHITKITTRDYRIGTEHVSSTAIASLYSDTKYSHPPMTGHASIQPTFTGEAFTPINSQIGPWCEIPVLIERNESLLKILTSPLAHNKPRLCEIPMHNCVATSTCRCKRTVLVKVICWGQTVTLYANPNKVLLFCWRQHALSIATEKF